MGIYSLVKWTNNGVTAVALEAQVRAFEGMEIERSGLAIVCFAPAEWFDGKYPVREEGLTGTTGDLRQIEAVIGEIPQKGFPVPFSNAGWNGGGWQSDLNEFGSAHESTFTDVFGEVLSPKGAEVLFRLITSHRGRIGFLASVARKTS